MSATVYSASPDANGSNRSATAATSYWRTALTRAMASEVNASLDRVRQECLQVIRDLVKRGLLYIEGAALS